MKKLFIDNEYKGLLKRALHNSSSRMWLFSLVGSDLAAIALRDDEILNPSSIICSGDEVHIEIKKQLFPAGVDADILGEKLIKNI